MEDNFLKDDFEQFLKGNADEFLMVPQRKVWYSIYNSMHPDRKWPSLAVCLLILSAILFLGISNNNSISDAARKAGEENMNDIAKNYAAQNTVNFLDPVTAFNKRSRHSSKFSMSSTADEDFTSYADVYADLTGQNEWATETGSHLNDAADAAAQNNKAGATLADEKLIVISASPDNSTHAQRNAAAAGSSFAKNRLISSTTVDGINELLSATDDFPLTGASAFAAPADDDTNISLTLSENKPDAKTTASKLVVMTNEQKAWIEDFAFYNRAGKNKFQKNASISYYITPSLGYRSINRKNGYTPAGSLILASRTLPSLYQALLDGAALNLEAGAALNYSISKKIRLKSGLQLNYMNYLSNGTDLGHPSQTSVAIMNNEEPMIRSTTFSVDGNNTKFNHRSLQVSIPIGADIKLAGNDKLKWYAGGTAQPTFILGGNALVLSADEKNLISEDALRRNWNLNMSVETFISYKTGSGIVFNAGPQFRYQMMSSFKKPYAYNERPYNFGIKMGIIKGF